MLATTLRHTFLQIWDQAVLLFCLNFAFLGAVFLAALLVEAALPHGPFAVFAAVALSVHGLTALYLVIASALDAVIGGDDERIGWRDLAGGVAMPALVFATTVLAVVAIAGFALAALLPLGGVLDAVGLAALVWLLALAAEVALFASAAVAAKASLGGAFKTALLIAFDNPGRAFLLLLVSLLLLASSIVVLPGPAGICLLMRNALRFMLRRYEAPSLSWPERLAEERASHARLGPKSLLFPWLR